MPYNPVTDATQVMGKPYKAALRELSKRKRNSQQNLIEMMIAQACQANGFRVEDFESKE